MSYSVTLYASRGRVTNQIAGGASKAGQRAGPHNIVRADSLQNTVRTAVCRTGSPISP